MATTYNKGQEAETVESVDDIHARLEIAYLGSLDFEYDFLKKKIISGNYNEDSFADFLTMLRKLDYLKKNVLTCKGVTPVLS